MRLFWVGLIFGAGYALGRPEGRAKLAELSKRPEVTQLRQRAASTVSSGAKTGQQQLANAAHTVRDKAAEKLPGNAAGGSGAGTEPAGTRRGLRLPSFPRRGARLDTSTMPAAGPVETATGTATIGTSPSSASVNAAPATPPTASPDAPDDPRCRPSPVGRRHEQAPASPTTVRRRPSAVPCDCGDGYGAVRGATRAG